MVELKTGEFKPEYAGQLNFYLSAVDGILKKDAAPPIHRPTALQEQKQSRGRIFLKRHIKAYRRGRI